MRVLTVVTSFSLAVARSVFADAAAMERRGLRSGTARRGSVAPAWSDNLMEFRVELGYRLAFQIILRFLASQAQTKIFSLFPGRSSKSRPAGTFFTEAKGVRHFGMTKDEGTVLYFVGTGPSTNDDPEK
jgi:hypothetical protein